MREDKFDACQKVNQYSSSLILDKQKIFLSNEKFYLCAASLLKKKPLEDIGEATALVPWQVKAIDAARIALSATNLLPWRFILGINSIAVCTDSPKDKKRYPKRLNRGIAMLHLEQCSLAAGMIRGRSFLLAPAAAKIKEN